MQVEVLGFAAARDALGGPRRILELEEGATVATALGVLADRYEALRALLPSLRVAVDEDFATPGTPLRSGATLALLPPVSGG